MAYYIKLYAVVLLGFIVLDFAWLGLVARQFYVSRLGFLMRERLNWTAAVTFYLLFVAGILVFVVLPSLEAGNWRRALLLGAMYGLVTYATYDLTNLATLKNWPLAVVLVDLAWGTILAAAVGCLGFWGGKWLA